MSTSGEPEPVISAQEVALAEAREVDWLMGVLSNSTLACQGEILEPLVQTEFEVFLGYGKAGTPEDQRGTPPYAEVEVSRDVADRAMQVFKEISQNYERQRPQAGETSEPAGGRRTHAMLVHAEGSLCLAVFDWGPVDETKFDALKRRLTNPPTTASGLDPSLLIGAAAAGNLDRLEQLLSAVDTDETLQDGRLADDTVRNDLVDAMAANGRGVSMNREFSEACGADRIFEADGMAVGMVQWYAFEGLHQAASMPQPASCH